jgi:hypothetical protein
MQHVVTQQFDGLTRAVSSKLSELADLLSLIEPSEVEQPEVAAALGHLAASLSRNVDRELDGVKRRITTMLALDYRTNRARRPAQASHRTGHETAAAPPCATRGARPPQRPRCLPAARLCPEHNPPCQPWRRFDERIVVL